MKSVKIRLTGFALWLFLCLGISSLPLLSMAQACAGSLGVITYDTVFSNNSTTIGSSGNSASFAYAIPKFPLSTLTLYAVSIKSNVSLAASVVVQNITTNPVIPSVKIFRSDDAYSDPTGDINNIALSPGFPTLSIPPGGLGTMVSPHAFNNYQLLLDSVNTADFALNDYIGSGTVGITYSTSSTPLVTNNVQVVSSTVTDLMHFTVTYYYCNPGTLATDVIAFSATRENSQTVDLNWITTNEQAGRRYDVEVSDDGATFLQSGSQAAVGLQGDASYVYKYIISAGEQGKLYFRLKITDLYGAPHYSIVRAVDLGVDRGGRGFAVYPNPAQDHVNIDLPEENASGSGGSGAEWQVDILAADGGRVQRVACHNGGTCRVNFLSKLAYGTYFVRATNLQTAKTLVAGFLVK